MLQWLFFISDVFICYNSREMNSGHSSSIQTILAIESSCDETACAIVQKNADSEVVEVLAETTATSLNKHIETKGIVPEVAAREQLKSVLPVIQHTLKQFAKTQQLNNITTQQLISHIDAIAITTGPGLIGSLLVGVETARSLAMAWNKLLIPVNHVEAHPYANFISNNITTQQPNNFPMLSWVISGGHTDLYYMKSHDKITRIGGKIDDSAGECFDKCARVLGFDYPGGPNIEKLSQQFLENTPENIPEVKLPRPLLHSHDFNTSFSGLKTAFARAYQELSQGGEFDQDTIKQYLAHELQLAVTDVIVKKTQLAIEKYLEVKGVLLSGGVAANQHLSNALKQLTTQKGLTFSAPPLRWCTDNAVMIGSYALSHLELKTSWSNVAVKL